MIAETNHNSGGLSSILGRIARVALKGIHTRAELLAVEWQEERLRLAEALLWAMALLLLGLMGLLLLTATIIFLFPENARVYVMGAFAVLYLLGAGGAWLVLRALLKRVPFAETIDQARKDRLWLESLK